MAVHRAYKGRRVGAALVRFVANLARSMQVEVIRSECASGDARLVRHFQTGLGFATVTVDEAVESSQRENYRKTSRVMLELWL